VGPLANERRVAALDVLIGEAVERGAELRAGGRRVGNAGNFFEPTVLANVPINARIMNEEPFGPVAIINPVGSLEEAIAEANRLPFGLASFAFTSSAAAIQALGTRIEAGMTTVNHNGLALPEVPFGEIKDSGYGDEGGSDAINAFLLTKFLSVA
jgi:succinate-semialdehyde dehydrogenase / glutarate-semialdehyde dehydrogenase